MIMLILGFVAGAVVSRLFYDKAKAYIVDNYTKIVAKIKGV